MDSIKVWAINHFTVRLSHQLSLTLCGQEKINSFSTEFEIESTAFLGALREAVDLDHFFLWNH